MLIHKTDQVTNINGKIFECDGCGECCKHVDMIPEAKNFDRGDGICKFLDDNNLCSIYNERPNLCRGEYLYHSKFEGMDVDEYYRIMHNLCEKLKGGKEPK